MCDDSMACDMAWDAHALAQENSKQLDRIEAALREYWMLAHENRYASEKALSILLHGTRYPIPPKGN